MPKGIESTVADEIALAVEACRERCATIADAYKSGITSESEMLHSMTDAASVLAANVKSIMTMPRFIGFVNHDG